MPIDDLYLLLRTGYRRKRPGSIRRAATSGRGPGWPDGSILTDVALPWLVQVLKKD